MGERKFKVECGEERDDPSHGDTVQEEKYRESVILIGLSYIKGCEMIGDIDQKFPHIDQEQGACNGRNETSLTMCYKAYG